MTQIIRLATHAREELIEITRLIVAEAARAGVRDGICCLFCRHTTAGLYINENADPEVGRDILLALRHLVPDSLPYRHGEGNSPAHVKAVLCGSSLWVPLVAGEMQLGRWQGVFFAEFDGPRQGREVALSFLPALAA